MGKTSARNVFLLLEPVDKLRLYILLLNFSLSFFFEVLGFRVWALERSDFRFLIVTPFSHASLLIPVSATRMVWLLLCK